MPKILLQFVPTNTRYILRPGNQVIYFNDVINDKYSVYSSNPSDEHYVIMSGQLLQWCNNYTNYKANLAFHTRFMPSLRRQEGIYQVAHSHQNFHL